MNSSSDTRRVTKATASTTPGDVILYIPNLIGYFRILLSTVALLLMSLSPTLWVLAIGLYLTSVSTKQTIHMRDQVLSLYNQNYIAYVWSISFFFSFFLSFFLCTFST